MSSPNISTQHACYQATSLSEEVVAKKSGFLMWDTQPSLFKSYPEHLFSYRFDDHDAFKVIKKTRFISSTINVAGKPYNRLNTPSAGNLHPVELYVQIRSIKGILSGLYHVDVNNERLVLIQELEADGIESYVGLPRRFQGMIFLISSVYYRSFWKYGIRSWRYLNLDVGHQIAALDASLALYGQEGTVLSDFDSKGLNHIMGFEHQEHVRAVVAVGQMRTRHAQPFGKALMQVQPTDYIMKDMTMQAWLDDAKVFHCSSENTYLSYDKGLLSRAIDTRRSAREFQKGLLFQKDIDAILDPLLTFSDSVELSYALFNAKDQEIALYPPRGGQEYKGIDLQTYIVKALLDQSIVASSGMVVFLTSNDFDEQVLMQAGRMGHRIYIESTIKGLGCSGIGAFYDEDLCAVLEKKYILYALVVGVA